MAVQAGAVVVNTTDGFEVVHGLADRLLLLFGLKPLAAAAECPLAYTYEYKASQNPTYFENRSVDLVVHPPKEGGAAGAVSTSIGEFGVKSCRTPARSCRSCLHHEETCIWAALCVWVGGAVKDAGGPQQPVASKACACAALRLWPVNRCAVLCCAHRWCTRW